MNNFIDIHNHTLPGLDDGARSVDQALSMLRIATGQGITEIIVTPHYRPDRYREKRKEYQKAFQALCLAASKALPGLKMYEGNEIYFFQDVIEELESGACRTLAGTDYVLIEFSTIQHYGYIKGAVELLTNEGYRPILAHVERYKSLNNNMERIAELVDLGALIQVNAHAVEDAGRLFKTSFVKQLLKGELVHFIATDAHDEDKRAPVLDGCEKRLKKWCRETYLRQITGGNQRLLLQNRYID
ncbi:hypothetical protein LQE92_06565 [Lacrimispora sp. NSJ-141]|uniref:protein-tyrosine-phosphatase n=1 Tax=Lientehia hominis TaxID=2897778 RepID=A0AAP2RK94_9FIRM|nr:CpsB/CapC family capsule biosynthesis tyrosine phosphatase [Lientehia hominis]MCD2492293.1 hypothetical protein [Lientehia hominis]